MLQRVNLPLVINIFIEKLRMRFVFWLYLITLLPAFGYADAGFNIGRPKAPCYAVFTGIDKLSDFEFFKVGNAYETRNRDKIFDSGYRLKDNDTLKLYYTEGKRYWQGPVKILIRNKTTEQFVDSFTLIAEGNNLTINFTAVQNNKIKYTVDKRKAEYPYELFLDENPQNAKRNKFILISLSIIGFLTLAFMFYKKRNSNIPLENS